MPGADGHPPQAAAVSPLPPRCMYIAGESGRRCIFMSHSLYG